MRNALSATSQGTGWSTIGWLGKDKASRTSGDLQALQDPKGKVKAKEKANPQEARKGKANPRMT